MRENAVRLCAELAPKDSNLDKQIQSLSCYRYTRGQRDAASLAAGEVVSRSAQFG